MAGSTQEKSVQLTEGASALSERLNELALQAKGIAGEAATLAN